MNLSNWSQEDLKSLAQLDQLLSKNVDWRVNSQELVQTYRSLVWLAGLKKKIEDNLAEVVSVRQVKEGE